MSYLEELRFLAMSYDAIENCLFDGKITLIVKMLRFEELKVFAFAELSKLIEKLTRDHDIKGLRMLKLVAYNSGFELQAFVPMGKTFYDDSQNVHILSARTIEVAKWLIEKFGDKEYRRPSEFIGYDAFFDALESHSFHAFEPTQLFSAVYSYTTRSRHVDELLCRMKQEMMDSHGLCVTGCIVRLVNALRGFDENVQVDLDLYEAAKTKAFHELTKSIDACGDNILEQIKDVVNKGVVSIPRRYALKILNSYTGEKWVVRKNIFGVKLNRV